MPDPSRPVPRSRRRSIVDSLPGRAVIVGVAARFAAALARVGGVTASTALDVVDIAAAVAIAAGAVYFVVQFFTAAKRRLLWRVRRKLILSYVFIGFVPSILIIAFFMLFVLLLFFNFSAYLVQNEMRSLDDQARLAATTAVLEIQRGGGRGVAESLRRTRDRLANDFPDVSLVLVPTDRTCSRAPAVPGAAGVALATAGSWSHMDPPREVPRWIDCSGFAGQIAFQRSTTGDAQETEPEMALRAVAFPDAALPGYAVIVDLPVDDAVKARLRADTGVEWTGVTAVTKDNAAASALRTAGSEVTGGTEPADEGPFDWVTFLAARDWPTGESRTMLVTTQLSLQEMYKSISSTQGMFGNRRFDQVLLVALITLGGLFLLIEVAALLAGFALARSITGSVHELFAGTERVRRGDFTGTIAVTADDQLGELAQSFNSMTTSIEDLLRQAQEKKRLEEELRIAREIQMSLLPQGDFAMPGLSVTALCVPAREVGGDYYDFLRIDEHRLGLLIADVSGKGTSAALYMAELKGLVLSLSRIYQSPRDMLVNANRIISEHLDARSFITMTYAVLDMKARTMTYARAGHTPLIFVPGSSHGDGRARFLAPDGLVVGLKLDEGQTFERLLQEETRPLEAGDVYMFFTDGITEAMNAAEDCFGDARLGRLIEAHVDLPIVELRERVLREVESFAGGAPQHDDMTMILLKIDEPDVSAGRRDRV